MFRETDFFSLIERFSTGLPKAITFFNNISDIVCKLCLWFYCSDLWRISGYYKLFMTSMKICLSIALSWREDAASARSRWWYKSIYPAGNFYRLPHFISPYFPSVMGGLVLWHRIKYFPIPDVLPAASNCLHNQRPGIVRRMTFDAFSYYCR